MDEYIKREDVLSYIYATHSSGGFKREDDYLWLHDRAINAAAADVQPVRHGWWIPQGDDMWLCSNCKKNIIYSMHESDRTEKQRYCCRCGARMDGDAE